ncbi:AaceriAFR704Wp [[Ashbya] aceris (nom. inval.)]|nr:AaceriAFR704Wp [[Ashbya] aceris (nom. inval.)]
MRATNYLYRTARRQGKPLLPPLHLYRRILRAHRAFPPAQRALGDEYVKSEFKLHKNTDNPVHIIGFLASWQDYFHMISTNSWAEGTLSKSLVDQMSSEQIVQLYELMKETKQLGGAPAENGSS